MTNGMHEWQKNYNAELAKGSKPGSPAALYAEIERLTAENERLRSLLSQSCRQWQMYANLQEDRDVATEQTLEGVLYRKCNVTQQLTPQKE